MPSAPEILEALTPPRPDAPRHVYRRWLDQRLGPLDGEELRGLCVALHTDISGLTRAVADYEFARARLLQQAARRKKGTPS